MTLQKIQQTIKIKGQFKSLPNLYVSFLGSLFISRLGDSLYNFAIPWISYKLTGSAVVMGSLFAINVLPIIVFGPIMGAIVDMWDRRKLMLVADILRSILVGAIPLLYLTDLLSLWHLYAVSFLLSILSLLFDVSIVSAIPKMAGNELTKANSYYQFTNQMAGLVGPLIAGGIVSIIGGFNTLWLDVISFGSTMIVVLRLPKLSETASKAKSRVASHIFKDIVKGFEWLIKNPLNLSFSVQAMVGNFGASAVLATLMYYLLHSMHLHSERIGLNYSFIGIGGLIGSLMVIKLVKHFKKGKLIVAFLVVGTFSLLITLFSHHWLAPGIGFGLVTMCNIAWNSIVTSVRQETVPPELLGRVLSFSKVFTRLAMPIGAFVGALLSSINPKLVFILAVASKGVEVIIAIFTPIRKLD